MLKLLRILFISAIAIIGLFSCSSCDDDDAPKLKTDREVNDWIYETMEIYYYWNDKLPTSPSFNQRPDDFFKSIYYKYDKNSNPQGDRFSVISSNYEELTNELSGIYANEIGFEYMLFQHDNSNNVYGEIYYVKPNTPATQQGLKRGQYFIALNGKRLTVFNYEDLFSLKGSYTLTVSNDKNATNGKVFTLSTVSNYIDNPNYLDSIYEVGNKKIGYYVYNFFADDSNDESQNFNIEMINIFNNFIDQGVTDLIIDLRYNLGGTLSSSLCMASMLVDGASTNDIYLQSLYNKLIMNSLSEKDKKDLYLRFAKEITPNKGGAIPLSFIGKIIDKLVILTGENTASASEMVINGLKPYNAATLIGGVTVGKNVGSMIFTDEENLDRNKWALLPIIVKFSNSAGESDFTAGFTPDILLYDNKPNKYPLGDRNEYLLNAAIDYIAGNGSIRSVTTEAPALKPIGSSLSRKAWSNRTLIKPFDRN